MTRPTTRRALESERRALDARLYELLDAGRIPEAIRMEPEYGKLARRAGAPEVLGYFLLDIGDAHYGKENHAEALKYYLAGLSELGNDPVEEGVGMLQVAYCYSFLNRTEEALKWLDRCLENRSFHQNGHAAAFSERARIEVERQRRYPEAIYHYLCALDLYEPKRPYYSAEGHQGTLYGLALTLDESGLTGLARSYYQKVVKMGPTDSSYAKEARSALQRLPRFSDPVP
jgi:tetratricopeptide (TPR) repeat protein